jgi:hypothetical protein
MLVVNPKNRISLTDIKEFILKFKEKRALN